MIKYIEITSSSCSHILKLEDIDGVTLTDRRLYITFKKDSQYSDLSLEYDRQEIYSALKKALLNE